MDPPEFDAPSRVTSIDGVRLARRNSGKIRSWPEWANGARDLALFDDATRVGIDPCCG